MNHYQPVPSKLLLFGEYSILAGSVALTVPLSLFTASLEFPDKGTSAAELSNKQIRGLVGFLKKDPFFKNHLDLSSLSDAVEQGLYLKSDIPQGYGLGSSAALCVAIYKAFGNAPDTNGVEALIEIYSKMEGYFHGKSSGIDPLAIHTGKALLVNYQGNKVSFLDRTILPPDIFLYLLDSGISRNSAQLIREFNNCMQQPDYREAFGKEYVPLLQRTVESFISQEALWNHLTEISALQLRVFSRMIPEPVREFWEKNSGNGLTCLKILGAGGGGFFLVFSKTKLPENGRFRLLELRL